MSGGYGSNQFPQYPGSVRRPPGSSSANSSSANGLNTNQSLAHYPASNASSYVQYPTGGYSQGFSSQNISGGSTASNIPDVYRRAQYTNDLAPGRLSYNSSAQPSGASLDSLYGPMSSNSPLMQQGLAINPGGGLNQDSYLSTSLGTTCPNPSHNSDSRVSHGVVRNHICPTCGKGFGRPSSLAQHEFIHTGERPYVCPVCERAFNTTSNLRRHQALHDTAQ